MKTRPDHLPIVPTLRWGLLRTYLAKLAEGAMLSSDAYWVVPSMRLGVRKGVWRVLRPIRRPCLSADENIKILIW